MINYLAKQRLEKVLRIQRDECVINGIDISDLKPLIKGENFSQQISKECFSELADFGFGIYYDEFGKPWPVGREGNVSISHTKQWLFISYSQKNAQGLDIEHTRTQLNSIAPRILHQQELAILEKASNRQSALQIFWGAKESLYKAFGRKQLQFAKHIRIDSFSADTPGVFTGSLILPEGRRNFELEWLKPDEDSWLVFVRNELTSPV
ncbi:MAG: 4'-phosphopantetheinyl transferase superfamily protein [Bacteroidia bacterium]